MPTIAVLPYDNLSRKREQEFLADGLTEDLVTALSYLRSFAVFASNSIFQFEGQSPSVHAVAQHLGCAACLREACTYLASGFGVPPS